MGFRGSLVQIYKALYGAARPRNEVWTQFAIPPPFPGLASFLSPLPKNAPSLAPTHPPYLTHSALRHDCALAGLCKLMGQCWQLTSSHQCALQHICYTLLRLGCESLSLGVFLKKNMLGSES